MSPSNERKSRAAAHPNKRRDESAQNALGEFLRARRQLVTPEEVGIPVTGRRRARGLRREELATLAGVSSPFYIRLEQGRDRHPSAQVIDALGRALRLDEETLAYFMRLAGHLPDGTRLPAGEESVRRSVAQLVQSLRDLPPSSSAATETCLPLTVSHKRYTSATRQEKTSCGSCSWTLARMTVSSIGNRLRSRRFRRCAPTPTPTLMTPTSVSSPTTCQVRARNSANCGPARRHHVHHRRDPLQQPTRRAHHPQLRVLSIAGALGQSLGIAFPPPGSADEHTLKRPEQACGRATLAMPPPRELDPHGAVHPPPAVQAHLTHVYAKRVDPLTGAARRRK
jgi:transcriptional regulator with XRE-family HTH domain